MSKPGLISDIAEELKEFGKTAKSQVLPENSKSQKSNEETKKLVEDLYKKGEPKQKAPEEPDEVKKQKLRSELHAQYYQNLVNPPKQKEERPTEKVEREKKQEMIDLQKKEQKKPSQLVQKAQQRVEKYPGASG